MVWLARARAGRVALPAVAALPAASTAAAAARRRASSGSGPGSGSPDPPPGGANPGAPTLLVPPPATAVIAPSREALRLYREILQTARGFWWEDDHGLPFGEQLARSARREFEDWRGETDPEAIANRIMVRRPPPRPPRPPPDPPARPLLTRHAARLRGTA